MTRALDFIVFGVARSGTKTLVRALNLHPHVYCAQERFYFRADHSQITFPDSFLDPSDIRNRYDLDKISRVRAAIAQKRDIRHIGNKDPRYYFRLAQINTDIPRLKNIWIYRSPYGFMQSWNRREAGRFSTRKGRWRAGQVGLFGLIELLCCIENCVRLKNDIFIFPYEHGLNRSSQPIAQALDFLGAAPGLHDLATFELRYLNKRRDASHRLSLQSYEQELLDTLRVRDLDQIIEQNPGAMVSEIAVPLRDYLNSIGGILPRAVDVAFAACDNRAASSFGREHFNRNRNELAGVLKLIAGSKALSDFQNFNLYQRVRALYVQRWALKRRLLSMWSSRATSNRR
jgi:hypothetical protein